MARALSAAAAALLVVAGSDCGAGPSDPGRGSGDGGRSSSGVPPSPPSPPPAQHAEEYAVWRAALADHYGARPGQLVLRDTAAGGPRPTQEHEYMHTCTPGLEPGLVDALDAQPSLPLGNHFGIDAEIRLLDPEQARAAMDCPEARADAAAVDPIVCFRQTYPGVVGLVTLTRVGFDAARTRALVRMTGECGEACCDNGFYELEKGDLGWKVVRVHCRYAC